MTDPRMALIALAFLGGPAFAQDGYANSPFAEHPAALARAAALERIEAAARGLSRLSEPEAGAEAEDEAGEEEEEGLAEALHLIQATLAAAQPETARALPEAIGQMLEAAGEGESPAGPAREVLALTERARAVLTPTDLAGGVPFQAALMAALLLDEGGVAESYEEASKGDAAGYAIGWASLQRVKALWDGVKAAGAPEAVQEAEATIAILDGLFPSETPPETLSPDPEEAEGPSHRLVGLLEVVADANLYPGRDLAKAAGLVADLAGQGCAAIAAGEGPKGMETLAIAAAYHEQALADTLGVIAPEAAEAVDENLEPLEDGEAEQMAAACHALLDALEAGGAALAP